MKTQRWALRDDGQEVVRVERPARSRPPLPAPHNHHPHPHPQSTEPPAPLSCLTLQALTTLCPVRCPHPSSARQIPAQPLSPELCSAGPGSEAQAPGTPRAAQTSVLAPNTQHHDWLQE